MASFHEPNSRKATLLNRRSFLKTSAGFLAANLFGLNFFSKSQAGTLSFPEKGALPRIAFIIDDIGYSLSRARRFLNLNVPITFSILPKLTYTKDLSDEINDQGHEIMLHQPMEPFNPDFDPGPGALYVGYETQRIIGILEENIEALPCATGVNNHMGSKFTSTRREIEDTLLVIKKGNLFFIDSLTSHCSKAYQTARHLHISAGYRNLFIDNRLEEKAIFMQLRKLVCHACMFGSAIGIGHPFPETALVLKKWIESRASVSVELVHVSQILTAI